MYVKKRNIVKREIHEEIFLIDIRQNYLNDKCSIYELNPMGAYIWDSLERYSSPMEIAEEIFCNIIEDINYRDIFNDVTEFLWLLKKENFLEYIDERSK